MKLVQQLLLNFVKHDMKSTVFHIVLLILLFISPRTYSQPGAKAGIGISDIAFQLNGQTMYLGNEIDGLTHNVPKFSYHGGISYNLDIANRFSLQPELMVAMKGLNYSEKFIYDHVIHKINILYLELPILAQYQLFKKENKQSGVHFGPYTSLKLNSILLMKVNGNQTKKYIKNVKNIDVGLTAGYFWNINLPNNDLIINLRTSYSLINMMNVPEGYVRWYYGPNKEYVRNVTIMLTVGYRFNNRFNNE